MNDLVDLIRSTVSYSKDPGGEIIIRRAKGSSIRLPVINQAETRENANTLAKTLLSEMSVADVLDALKRSVTQVKSDFIRAHDGFRVARGARRGSVLTIGELHAFAVAAGYCFDSLPRTKGDSGVRVGIGVMAPAVQDCGKNLIKLIWKTTGHEIIDLGNTVKPKNWLNAILHKKLSVVGISCMTNKCIDNLRKLLSLLVQSAAEIPIIVGGVAVNKVIAFNLGDEYGINIYYGKDICDAAEILQKSLMNKAIPVPDVKIVEEITLQNDTLPIIEQRKLRIFKIRISDIVIDGDARIGCSSCSGDKRRLCPLEIGFEKQKSLDESIEFSRNFKYAVLVSTEIPDENNRSSCKSLWESLLKVEQHFELCSNQAQAFRFPMTCPFCLPRECQLHKGFCVFPTLYRDVHEQYNINISNTLSKVFGDNKPTGICSIILVR
jgi:predicted metal-binding protein/methylmalonyl-CoA mutase cobalamin-binding subunit